MSEQNKTAQGGTPSVGFTLESPAEYEKRMKEEASKPSIDLSARLPALTGGPQINTDTLGGTGIIPTLPGGNVPSDTLDLKKKDQKKLSSLRISSPMMLLLKEGQEKKPDSKSQGPTKKSPTLKPKPSSPPSEKKPPERKPITPQHKGPGFEMKPKSKPGKLPDPKETLKPKYAGHSKETTMEDKKVDGICSEEDLEAAAKIASFACQVGKDTADATFAELKPSLEKEAQNEPATKKPKPDPSKLPPKKKIGPPINLGARVQEGATQGPDLKPTSPPDTTKTVFPKIPFVHIGPIGPGHIPSKPIDLSKKQKV